MKKILSLLILLVCQQAFSQQDIRQPYGEWHNVYFIGTSKVEVSFSVSTCNENGIIGNSYYRIRNTFNKPKAYVKFRFEWRGCNGKIVNELVTVDLSKPGIDDYLGNHFFGVEVLKIYDVKFEDYGKPKDSQTNENAAEKAINTKAQGYSFPGEKKTNQNKDKYNQQEQQKRQQEEQRKQQEAARQQQEENRQKQMTLINEANKQRAKAFESSFNALGSIGDYLITSSVQKSIDREDSERKQRFSELENSVRTKNGELVDCSRCNGEGGKRCSKCRGNGVKNCNYCNSSGQSKCTFCYGSGTVYGNTCSVCGGKGTLKCSYCFGKGKNICTDCHGLGTQRCTYCRGTGKEYKEDYNSNGESKVSTEKSNNSKVNDESNDLSNADLLFKQGVLSSESNNFDDAERYYRQVLKLDPNYFRALYNLSELKLRADEKIVLEMNKLGTTEKEDKRYEVLKLERSKNFQSILPYLEKALELKPDDESVKKVLLNIYKALEMTDRYNTLQSKM